VRGGAGYFLAFRSMGRSHMMSRRRFLSRLLRFLPAVAAAPLAQFTPPEREPQTPEQKRLDKAEGQIFYLLDSDRRQNGRLDRIEQKLPTMDPFGRYRKKTM